MPHFILEYSANIEPDLALDDLMADIHEAALESGIFPLGGLRVRAVRRDHYIVADGRPENAFVHLVARIRAGRPLAVRQTAGKLIFDRLCQRLDALYGRRPLALSFEIQEIDPDLSFKKNNIHDYLAQKKDPS